VRDTSLLPWCTALRPVSVCIIALCCWSVLVGQSWFYHMAWACFARVAHHQRHRKSRRGAAHSSGQGVSQEKVYLTSSWSSSTSSSGSRSWPSSAGGAIPRDMRLRLTGACSNIHHSSVRPESMHAWLLSCSSPVSSCLLCHPLLGQERHPQERTPTAALRLHA
jgi:hypothetical protein